MLQWIRRCVREWFERKVTVERRVTVTVTSGTIDRHLIWHGNGQQHPVSGMLGWTIGIGSSDDHRGPPPVIVHRLLSNDRKCFITATDRRDGPCRNVFIDEETEDSQLRFGPDQKKSRTYFEIEPGFNRIFLKRDDRYVIVKEGEDDSCPCILVLGPSGERPDRSPFSLEEIGEFREEFREEIREL